MGEGRASSSQRETEVHHKEGPRRQRWPRVPLTCSVCVVLPGLGPRKVAPLLLSQGPHTSSRILPTRAQISRRPHILPPLAPPWLPGGDTGLKVAFHFFFCQERTNNSMPGGKGPAPHWPLAESPGSPTHVTEAAEKGKTARPVGPGGGGRFICE